jgi:hypothetical protein
MVGEDQLNALLAGLALRFIAGVTKPARPAAQAEPIPAPAAEPVAA